MSGAMMPVTAVTDGPRNAEERTASRAVYTDSGRLQLAGYVRVKGGARGAVQLQCQAVLLHVCCAGRVTSAARSSCEEGCTHAVTVQLLLLLMMAVMVKEVLLMLVTHGQLPVLEGVLHLLWTDGAAAAAELQSCVQQPEAGQSEQCVG